MNNLKQTDPGLPREWWVNLRSPLDGEAYALAHVAYTKRKDYIHVIEATPAALAAKEMLEALRHAESYIKLSMPQYSAELMKRLETAITKATSGDR